MDGRRDYPRDELDKLDLDGVAERTSTSPCLVLKPMLTAIPRPMHRISSEPGSLLNSEVKWRRARLVLGWGTAWEDLRVLIRQWRSLRPLALPSFVARFAPLRRTTDALPWSLVQRQSIELPATTVGESSRGGSPAKTQGRTLDCLFNFLPQVLLQCGF